MTQFNCVSSDEEVTGSPAPSKLLKLSLTDIARPGGELSKSTSGQQSEDLQDVASSPIAKVTILQNEENPVQSDEFHSKSQSNRRNVPESSVPTVRRSKRIRHSYKAPEVRQTTMGLPKPLRLPKKEFTVEEIYLNKNYRTPPEKSFETIFEFPKEHRDGTVMTYGKAKKKRKCVFTIDFTKKTAKRKKHKGLKRKRLKFESNADEVLKQKLLSLDNALALADLSP